MCKVYYSAKSDAPTLVRECATIEEGIAFALDLHRSSNVEHLVAVMYDGVTRLTLTMKDDGRPGTES